MMNDATSWISLLNVGYCEFLQHQMYNSGLPVAFRHHYCTQFAFTLTIIFLLLL